MSVRVINAVFQINPAAISATERLVLLTLASHANDRGKNAFPSVSRIGHHTSLTRRAIQKALGRLKDKGLIVDRGRTEWGATRYAIAVKTVHECALGAPLPANEVRPRGAHQVRRGANVIPPGAHDVRVRGARGAPNPSCTREDPLIDPFSTETLALLARPRRNGGKHTSATPRDAGLRDRFEAFWQTYPKKVGKDKAWSAWQKRRPGQELTEQIVAALAWQRQQDNWLREGGRFVPNPATWINQGRWQDEPSTTPRLSDRTLALMRAGEEFLKS